MKKIVDNKKIGIRIQNLRESFRLTQEQFAKLCTLSLGTVQAIENGRRGMSLDSLLTISRQLNVSCDYLLTGEINETVSSLASSTTQILSNMDEKYYTAIHDFLLALLEDIDRNFNGK